MTWDRDFDAFFPHQVMHERCTGQQDDGTPLHAAPVAVMARVQSEVPKATNMPGEEQVSYSTVFLKPVSITGGAVVPGPRDRLTLPETFQPRVVPIVTMKRVDDDNGVHHYRLRVLMRDSTLQRRITLQEPVKTQDPVTGEEIVSYVDVAILDAEVRPLPGEEIAGNFQVQAWGLDIPHGLLHPRRAPAHAGMAHRVRRPCVRRARRAPTRPARAARAARESAVRVSLHGKVSGFQRSAETIRSVGRELGDEDVIREGLHQAAGAPLVARMKENIRKLTGRTADDISVVDEPSRAGVPRIRVGAKGGKGGRGFIGSFLEWGTRHMGPRPWARPAYDAEKDRITARLADFLRERLRRTRGGGR